MDFKEIQELIKIISESNLTTMELEQDGFKIVLKKETEKIISREIVQGNFAGPIIGGQPPSGTGYPAAPAAHHEQGHAAEPAKPAKPLEQTINSPIVGTFYSAASPGAEPFVQAGSSVKKGDTLCIIEAMKLMNEIEAEEDLFILDVLVNDGQMVEYGQPLYVIKK